MALRGVLGVAAVAWALMEGAAGEGAAGAVATGWPSERAEPCAVRGAARSEDEIDQRSPAAVRAAGAESSSRGALAAEPALHVDAHGAGRSEPPQSFATGVAAPPSPKKAPGESGADVTARRALGQSLAALRALEDGVLCGACHGAGSVVRRVRIGSRPIGGGMRVPVHAAREAQCDACRGEGCAEATRCGRLIDAAVSGLLRVPAGDGASIEARIAARRTLERLLDQAAAGLGRRAAELARDALARAETGSVPVLVVAAPPSPTDAKAGRRTKDDPPPGPNELLLAMDGHLWRVTGGKGASAVTAEAVAPAGSSPEPRAEREATPWDAGASLAIPAAPPGSMVAVLGVIGPLPKRAATVTRDGAIVEVVDVAPVAIAVIRPPVSERTSAREQAAAPAGRATK